MHHRMPSQRRLRRRPRGSLTWAMALRSLILGSLILGSYGLPGASAQEGTLGIDCEQPRTNAEGRLILGDDGAYRAICEANRSTALNYVQIVTETRDRLRTALNTLPPPIWADLVTHLTTSDRITTWTYTDSTLLTALQSTFPALHAVTARWSRGILAGSTLPPEWQAHIRVRASGTDFDDVILIWLEPTAVRDRWTPESIQRTARAWIESREGKRVFGDRLPRIKTAGNQLKDVDGTLTAIAPDATIQAAFASVPANALVMSLGVHHRVTMGQDREPCTGANDVGFRQLSWERHNGIYVVPDTALLDDGTAHPRRGEPLLGLNGLPSVNETNPDDGLFLSRSTCRAPRTLDAVRTVDCDATLAGQAVQGKHVRTFRFREVQNDPTEPYRIDMVPVGPGNGELGVTAVAGAPHPVWEETTLFCEPGAIPDSDAPEIPDPVEEDWGYPDCATQWGGRYDRGDRYGHRRTVTYPPGWPVDEVEVRHIDDYCFNLTWVTGTQYRAGPACPDGHSGAIIEGRDLRWQDRDWAVKKTPAARDVIHTDDLKRWFKRISDTPWTRTLRDVSDPSNRAHMEAVGAVHDAGGTGLDRVVRVTDWHVDLNSCAAPVAASGTETRSGPECPEGQIGAITEGRDYSWYAPGPPSPACSTLPEYGNSLCTTVIGQQTRVPACSSLSAAIAAWPSCGGGWYNVVTRDAGWRETSNTCRVPPPPSTSYEGGGNEGDGGGSSGGGNTSSSGGGHHGVDGDHSPAGPGGHADGCACSR